MVREEYELVKLKQVDMLQNIGRYAILNYEVRYIFEEGNTYVGTWLENGGCRYCNQEKIYILVRIGRY